MRSIFALAVLLAVAFAAVAPDRHALYERVQTPDDWLVVGPAPKTKLHKLTIALPPKNEHVLIVLTLPWCVICVPLIFLL